MEANRLIKEKSPYLLQHAHNPVDWYPWGPEAFEKARKEDKPILVSIGYSTCHWCHVMEHESYEDPAVAELMNKYLVNIKVDREERPDVDKIYMTAVSAMTGQGGWPLNMFLTPELKPIYGGTYFPPEARYGHPAWRDVVTQIGESWKDTTDRQKMLEASNHITESLKKYVESAPEPLAGDPEWLDKGFRSFKATYDAERGGFGPAPKFPMPVYHNFLLRYYARKRYPSPSPLPGERVQGEGKEALDMSLHTLREMARGGIYDHLGGGFARYSTDEFWHEPHYEKMLYDNAQLAVNYLEAYQITKEDDFKRIAQETLGYIQRDMTHPKGGFYSAEDADSLPAADAKHKEEGAFYLWRKNEIASVLGEAAEGFCHAYGIGSEGNHILHRQKNAELYTQERHKLLEARERRPRPHLDDKIIGAWNGLMITAFAKAYQVLGLKTYLESAQGAATFLYKNLYDPKTAQLYRSWREGERSVPAIADDYAFVAQGLLDLYESDFDAQWFNWAIQLMESLRERFSDPQKGGYFMTATGQDGHLILRVKEDMDNVEPSASSVAALNLLRIAQLAPESEGKAYQDLADKTLKAFGMNLKESPRAMPQMLVALDFALTEPRQIVIAGHENAADTLALLKVVHDRFIPVKTVTLAGPQSPYKPLNGKAAAYVCVHHTCKEPTSDPARLAELLQ